MLSFDEALTDDEYRILIIDDNQEIHNDFKKILNPGNKEITDKIDAIYAKLFDNKVHADRDFAFLPKFQLDSAYQGIESLELVEKAVNSKKPYALAFVDIRMPPGWGGIETVKRIWQKDSDIQVVLCTAFSDYSWTDMIRHLGQTDRLLILRKPFDEIELIQIACALTTKWSLQRKSAEKLSELKKINSEKSEELEKNICMNKTSLMQLIQSSRMASIGQLAAGVAHEINNPVSYVLSNTLILKDYINKIKQSLDGYESFLQSSGQDDEKKKKQIEELIQQNNLAHILKDSENIVNESLEGLERVKTIVSDLNVYFHSDLQESEDININHCIESSIKIIPLELKNKYTLKKDFGVLPVMRGNNLQLGQVFLNMLVNAAQSIPDKGNINVKTEFVSDEIIITISDTGTGIAPEHFSKLFYPFFTTKPVGVGTGLGLSISNTIVKNHSGRITVESIYGKGTTFKIYFPIKQQGG